MYLYIWYLSIFIYMFKNVYIYLSFLSFYHLLLSDKQTKKRKPVKLSSYRWSPNIRRMLPRVLVHTQVHLVRQDPMRVAISTLGHDPVNDVKWPQVNLDPGMNVGILRHPATINLFRLIWGKVNANRWNYSMLH